MKKIVFILSSLFACVSSSFATTWSDFVNGEQIAQSNMDLVQDVPTAFAKYEVVDEGNVTALGIKVQFDPSSIDSFVVVRRTSSEGFMQTTYKNVANLSALIAEASSQRSELLSKGAKVAKAEPAKVSSDYVTRAECYSNYSKPSTSHVIHTGSRGGKYYINAHGKKTYIKK